MLEALLVAVIAATPGTLAAISSHKSRKILKGNGKGRVDQMLEEVLEWQGQHAADDEARFSRLEGAVKNVARRAKRG